MLLQEIYAIEAMQDAGITGDLSIVHAEQPQTIVNGKDYGLLFPKRIFTFENKTIKKLFISYYCFYITKFKYHLFIHNLPVPIPYVASVYGGMRLCSVILVFDDYNKLFHYSR